MIRTTLCLFALSFGLTATPLAAAGPGNAGSYLAAQHAGFTSDFAKAAEYYTRALSLDPRNTVLMERALTSQISLGRFDRAVPVLRRIEAAGITSPLANIVQLTRWAETDDYAAAAAAYGAGFTVGGLLDGLVSPWVAMGEGRVSDALAGFDELAGQPGLKNIAYYHKALVLAVAGDLDGADAILSGAAVGPVTVPRRGLEVHLRLLSQLGRNAAALERIEQVYGPMPPSVIRDMKERLAAGETLPMEGITNARDGLAEAFYSIAQALLGEASDSLTLLYSRTANELNPDHVDALLLTARLLENVEQYDLATGVYDRVPSGHPAYLNAEFGRATALRRSDRTDAAIEVLKHLTKSYPDLPVVHEVLGDTLRQQDRWAEANAAYDQAVALLETVQDGDWNLFFARGIVLERQKDWPAAERDFRKALDLSPDQPQVLNYLGYTLVERREKLDEALDMIKTAVAASPDAGYIVDSLGWVYFRLGRYSDAVDPMERAVELMAVDPVVNDHLGDVYWAVGRKLEAEFQWRRALSFVDYGSSSEEVDPERIRRKLDVGLDQVLEEEGAEPLVRTNGDSN